MPQQLLDQWAAGTPTRRSPDELPDELIQFYRGLFAQEMADWPAGHSRRSHRTPRQPGLVTGGLQEAKNIDQLYDEVRHAGPMPDVPLIVLCSIGIDPFKTAVSQGVR